MTRRVSKAADPDTETFIPAVTFDGYPDGKTTRPVIRLL